MNKKVYAIAVALLAVFFVACGDDEETIDQEWKTLNEQAFYTAESTGDFIKLTSQSANGYVLWKYSDEIKDEEIVNPTARITSAGKPEYTDSVSVRYEGWYIDKAGKKIVFDTTEGSFNGTPKKMEIKGLIDGWITVLQDMTEGEQREVWIPWQLGYGASGSSAIPAYTTLRFTLKLEKIIPMKGRS